MLRVARRNPENEFDTVTEELMKKTKREMRRMVGILNDRGRVTVSLALEMVVVSGRSNDVLKKYMMLCEDGMDQAAGRLRGAGPLRAFLERFEQYRYGARSSLASKLGAPYIMQSLAQKIIGVMICRTSTIMEIARAINIAFAVNFNLMQIAKAIATLPLHLTSRMLTTIS